MVKPRPIVRIVTEIRLDPATLPGRACPAAAALQFVGDRWALLAVREISYGYNHFNQIVRNTGAPRDRLAVRLKHLVEVGVLTKDDGYQLTESGRDLLPVIWAMAQWGNKWAVTEPVTGLRHHDHDFVPATACATCGEDVTAGDVVVAPVQP
jgi:DNA-binding HxlR family transcriptional regulator